MIPLDRGEGGIPPTRPRFPFREFVILFAACFFFTNFSSAQALRGTLIHEETIRVSPSADTAKLGEAERGHELIIIETSREWTHVEAVLANPQRPSEQDDE